MRRQPLDRTVRFISVFLVLLMPLSADWTKYEAENFTLYTDGKESEARDALVELEQFRHAFGRVVGDEKIRPAGDMVVLFYPSQEKARAFATEGPIERSSDRYYFFLYPKIASTPEFREQFARFLLETGANRMPDSVEQGLITLFSTLAIDETKITLGAPPPNQKQTADWARMHMLAVTDEFYGRLPVYLRNLRNGLAIDVAVRNSLGLKLKELDDKASAYRQAANFGTRGVVGLPIDAKRDFVERKSDDATVDAIFAGIRQAREQEAEYNRLVSSAKTESNSEKASAGLNRAIQLRPGRTEAYVALAARSEGKQRVDLLVKASELTRRDPAVWDELAKAYRDVHRYEDSAKAWLAAEQASTDPKQRDAFQASRLDLERLRLDYEAAERRRIEAEKQAEIDRLKKAEIARLRELERKVNEGAPAEDPNKVVVEWWDGPQPAGNVQGKLQRVDCLGKQARLHILDADGKLVKLMIRDAGKVVIMGAGEAGLGCGPQKAREIKVSFFPKKDAKLGTEGDAATIEFAGQ